MIKKHGSALLLTLIVSSIIVIFSISLLTLVNIEYTTESAVLRYEKMKLAAESGIDRGVTLLKTTRGVIPSYPDNIIKFNTNNNTIQCSVELTYINGGSTGKGKFLISSKASDTAGKHSKTVSAFIEDTGSFKKDFYIDNVLNNSLTVVSNMNSSDSCPVEFGQNSSINLYGTLYIQGSHVKINKSSFGSYKAIFIKANDLDITNNSFEKDRIYADIPDEKFYQKDNSFKNSVSRLAFSRMECLSLNPELQRLIDNDNGILTYSIDSAPFDCSLSSIDSEIVSYIRSKPLISDTSQILQWDLLTADQKKELSFYINNRNYTRLVFINGNLTVDSGIYDNYLILCTGTITVNNSSTFNNSSLYCSRLFINKDSSLTIYPADKINLGSKTDFIRSKFTNRICGYLDYVEVKIVNWIDG